MIIPRFFSGEQMTRPLSLDTYQPFDGVRRLLSGIRLQPTHTCLATAIKVGKVALLALLVLTTFILETILCLPLLAIKHFVSKHRPTPPPTPPPPEPPKPLPDRYDLRVGTTKLSLIEGDITRQNVDAIVLSASSPALADTNGWDSWARSSCGAIHAAAGPALRDECLALPEIEPGVRCKIGDAKITGAGQLPPPIRHVIHAVGPVVQQGDQWKNSLRTDQKNIYLRCLELAHQQGLKRIAMTPIRAQEPCWGNSSIVLLSAAFMKACEAYAHAHPDHFDELQLVIREPANFEIAYHICRHSWIPTHAVRVSAN